MTERHQSHRALGESAPNPLEAIVGRWRTDGQVIAKEPVPVWGSDVYEMFPGGHFLIHHVDVTVGQSPVRAIEIIGERDAARGVRSTLSVAADGQTMTAFWERTEDGQTWQPWMDIRFTRAADASATG